MRPGAIFVQAAKPFARAVAQLGCPDAPVFAVECSGDALVAWDQLLAPSLSHDQEKRIDDAHAAVSQHHIARILFTSGSTGIPKAVPITFAGFQATLAYQADAFGALLDRVSVFLEWFPWRHAYGGVLNFGMSVFLGAKFYIDDGRPIPGQFDKTVRNLHQVSPTIFTNVPSA